MSKIRASNTQIELLVFKALRKKGIFFQRHYRVKRVNIDIAIPEMKVAIFINGDFWHGWHFNVNKSRLPKKYWVKKIKTNILRDKRNQSRLSRAGWYVLRVWEHELKKDPEKAIKKIIRFIRTK